MFLRVLAAVFAVLFGTVGLSGYPNNIEKWGGWLGMIGPDAARWLLVAFAAVFALFAFDIPQRFRRRLFPKSIVDCRADWLTMQNDLLGLLDFIENRLDQYPDTAPWYKDIEKLRLGLEEISGKLADVTDVKGRTPRT